MSRQWCTDALLRQPVCQRLQIISSSLCKDTHKQKEEDLVGWLIPVCFSKTPEQAVFTSYFWDNKQIVFCTCKTCPTFSTMPSSPEWRTFLTMAPAFSATVWAEATSLMRTAGLPDMADKDGGASLLNQDHYLHKFKMKVREVCLKKLFAFICLLTGTNVNIWQKINQKHSAIPVS